MSKPPNNEMLEIREEYLPFGRPNFSEEEINAVTQVMRSGWIGSGKEVIAFEQELQHFIQVKHVVAVNSCTSALYLSLLASGIKAGDEVIVPSLTWCSSANAAIYCGATPVFCDCDGSTFSLSVSEILKCITSKTKAVIVVHYGGLAFEVNDLRLALPSHIKIIEDAAHAFGSVFKNNMNVGASGNLTCFSFYANKNLSTGEGGAICTNDSDLANTLKNLRQQGAAVSAWNSFVDPSTTLFNEVVQLGHKMNYTDLNACIGRVQLKRFEILQNKRHTIAKLYHTGLQNLKEEVEAQAGLDSARHSKHLFVVKLKSERLRHNRDEIVFKLRKCNVGANVHYMPLHLMSYYRENYPVNALPVTEQIFKQLISLPISSSMEPADAEYVLETFKAIIASYN